MSNPKLLDMPLAQNADKNDIPVTDDGSTGLFSQQYGWQLINAIPPQNGGKAVKREDFNGVFNLIGDLLYHIQKGYTFEFDSKQSYWKGCKVRDPATGLTYQALNDIPANSTNSPHEDTSNWVICPAEQGYIIPSTAYAVGATANHYALPPSYYLECTTPGTTGATAPVISSVTAGDTITDGTVVWTVRQCLPTSGGTLIGNTVTIEGKDITDGDFVLSAGNGGGYISLHGATKEASPKGVDIVVGGTDQILRLGVNKLLYGREMSQLNNLGGSAIVAKAITNVAKNYIKYSIGLIYAWGTEYVTGNLSPEISFPISFSAGTRNPAVIAVAHSSDGSTLAYLTTNGITSTKFSCKLNTAVAFVSWVAIGY